MRNSKLTINMPNVITNAALVSLLQYLCQSNVKYHSTVLRTFKFSWFCREAQGFTSNLKIYRFITYPHDKYKQNFFVHMLFSDKLLHGLRTFLNVLGAN